MVSQVLLKRSNHNSGLQIFLLRILFEVLLFIYDLVTVIPFYFFANPQQRLLRGEMKKASPVIEGDPSSPWKQCLVDVEHSDDELLKCKTLAEIWDNAVKRYPNRDCFGTRKFISVTSEVQPDGRLFEKLELGPYQWKTYSEVDVLVNDVIKGLFEIGQKEKEKVLIYSDTREEFTIALLACFKGKFPALTVYTTLGCSAVVHSVRECKPTTIFVSAKMLDMLAKALIEECESIRNIIVFSHRDPNASVVIPKEIQTLRVKILQYQQFLQIGSDSKLKAKREVQPNDIAMIMYTSGTTAAPKGVILQQKNIATAVKAHAHRFNMGSENTYAGFLPLAHIFEICAEFVCFLSCWRIGFSTPLTLFSNAPGLKKGQLGDFAVLQPTIVAATPAIFNRVVQSINDAITRSSLWKRELFSVIFNHLDKRYLKGYDDNLLVKFVFHSLHKTLGGRIKYLICGGAPINPDTLRSLKICFGCPVTQAYASTETGGGGVACCFDNLKSDEVGPPEILNEIMLREWSEGGYSPKNKIPQGEIIIGGDGVALGYLNNEAQTKEAFFNMYGKRWFATGDIGEFRPDGSLRVIDRKKDLIKLSQGEYVSFGKVESYLTAMPFIENICVCGNSQKDYIVALIVARMDRIIGMAQTIGINETDYDKLCANKEIKNKVISEINAYCKGRLHKMEIPRKVYLLHEIWTPNDGLVTAAFKVKRKCVEERFKKQIDEMYSDS